MVATFAIISRLDSHVRVEGTFTDLSDRIFYNVVSCALVRVTTASAIHRYLLHVECRSVSSRSHTVTLSLTLSQTHFVTHTHLNAGDNGYEISAMAMIRG